MIDSRSTFSKLAASSAPSCCVPGLLDAISCFNVKKLEGGWRGDVKECGTESGGERIRMPFIQLQLDI